MKINTTRNADYVCSSRDFVRRANATADLKVLKNMDTAYRNTVWNVISFSSVAEYYLYKATDELINIGISDIKRNAMLNYFTQFKEMLSRTNTGGENLTFNYMYEVTRAIKRNLDAFSNAVEKNIREEGIGYPEVISKLACAMKFMEEACHVYYMVEKPLKRFKVRIPKDLSSSITFLDLSYYKACEILDILDPKKRSVTRSHENTSKTFNTIIEKLLNKELISKASLKAIKDNE